MKIFVVLMAFLTGGCFLLVKPTKDFPDLKISYISTGYNIKKVIKEMSAVFHISKYHQI